MVAYNNRSGSVMTTSRHGVIITAVALAVVASGMGIAAYPTPATAQGSQLTIEATTTQTNAPAKGVAIGEQPIELHFEWSGLGSGSHDMRIAENDPAGWDDLVREFTVEGDSGSRTFHLTPEELEGTKDTGPEDMAHLEVRWGEEGTSNTVGLWWQHTTVYTKGYHDLPDEVEPGEEVTIEYYGYTMRDENHVRLVEDDHPHRGEGGGDEQIRREQVTGPGYFEGTFTFTPSDYIERGNRGLEVQSRAADERVHVDLVRNITVAEPEEEIDARISELSPPAGEYHAGQDISNQVTVENTGNVRHTFFVGNGVVDESGTVYDNDGSRGTQISLDPGDIGTVTVSWTVEEDAPTGTYDVGASVWEESNPQNLDTRLDDARSENAFEVVEAPETPTDTESEAAGSEPSETTEQSEEPVDTETGTPTGDDASGDSGDVGADAADEDIDEADTDEDGPGLGSISALIALATFILIVNRRT